MVSRNMLHSTRESRFIVDSFVEGDSEFQHEDDDEAEEEDKSADGSNGVTKAVSKEAKKVRMWRYLVMCMLLVAGASTSALTYLLLHGEEEEDFETSVSFCVAVRFVALGITKGNSCSVSHTSNLQYALFTATIKDTAITYFSDIQVVFDGLAETITGAAISSGETFPFVTVPMFEVQGEHSRRATGVEAVTFAPLVAEDKREQWEAYAWKNQGWLEESRKIARSTGEILQNSQHLESPISPILYQHENSEPPFSQIPAVEAPFLPAWHVSVGHTYLVCDSYRISSRLCRNTHRSFL